MASPNPTGEKHYSLPYRTSMLGRVYGLHRADGDRPAVDLSTVSLSDFWEVHLPPAVARRAAKLGLDQPFRPVFASGKGRWVLLIDGVTDATVARKDLSLQDVWAFDPRKREVVAVRLLDVMRFTDPTYLTRNGKQLPRESEVVKATTDYSAAARSVGGAAARRAASRAQSAIDRTPARVQQSQATGPYAGWATFVVDLARLSSVPAVPQAPAADAPVIVLQWGSNPSEDAGSEVTIWSAPGSAPEPTGSPVRARVAVRLADFPFWDNVLAAVESAFGSTPRAVLPDDLVTVDDIALRTGKAPVVIDFWLNELGTATSAERGGRPLAETAREIDGRRYYSWADVASAMQPDPEQSSQLDPGVHAAMNCVLGVAGFDDADLSVLERRPDGRVLADPAAAAPATAETPAAIAPAVDAPAEEPSTEAPAAEAASVEAPSVQAPSVEAPAPEAPEAPAAEAPAAQAPSVEAPVKETAAADGPAPQRSPSKTEHAPAATARRARRTPGTPAPAGHRPGATAPNVREASDATVLAIFAASERDAAGVAGTPASRARSTTQPRAAVR